MGGVEAPSSGVPACAVLADPAAVGRCRVPGAEWWKLPEDWAAETPIFFRRTAFSQLKGCESPEI
eukprot:2585014-Prymnesium_polylepis.1